MENPWSLIFRVYKMLNDVDKEQLASFHQCSDMFNFFNYFHDGRDFVDGCQAEEEIDTVSYHKLFDVLKQFQNEVNDIRSERLARSANPLALLAAAQPYSDNYYQAPVPQRSNAPSYKQSSSTRTSASTRHKGKEIAKPVTPQSESVSEEDSDPEQARRDKDMQKNLALLAKYFKKLYKPTNNNLRTSSNSTNKTEDTTPRYNNDNQSRQFGNQRTVTVAGARETVGSPVVQKTGIQCFNCKGFGHYARECRKPKRVKDYAYHKEKMMMCKQAEQGVPLQAEQADWLEDTDEEIDEQELEAHYSYMAKIQEVSPAESSSTDTPLEQVQNHDENDVFANVRRHSEQPESINDTYVLEKDDSNVVPDPSNICTNDNQVDQNATECVDERDALANLIANLTLDNEENKTFLKQLKKANASLTQELKECKTNLDESSRALGEATTLQTKQTELEKYTALNDLTSDYKILQTKLNETLGLLALKDIDIKEGLKTKTYEISVVNQKHDELVKKSLLTRSQFEGQLKEKTKVISDLKVKEGKDIDTMIEMDKQIKFLNEILYKRNQSIQTIHMLAPKCATYHGRSTFANPKYLKKAQSDKPRLYEIPYDTSDPANRFCPDGEDTVTLEKESRSKLDKDKVKPYDYTYQNSLYETFKPPSKTYLDQLERAKEVRKTMWRKTFVRTKPNIAKNLKKLIENCKGKSVETQFNKPSVVRQPNAQRIPKPSVLGKPTPFSNSPEMRSFQTKQSVNKTNVSDGLFKQVTQQNLPQIRKQAVRNTNVIAPGPSRNCPKHVSHQSPREKVGSNDMVHNYYLEKAKKSAQLQKDKEVNGKPSMIDPARLPNTANGCKPKPRNWQASMSSRVSNKDVHLGEHRKQKPFLKFNDLQCPTCKKCLYSANHDECVLEYLSRLNPRASAQNKDAKSHKTTKRYMPVEKSSASKKPERQIPTGHRFSNKKTTTVPEKTMNPRSCLRWKPTGRIFSNVRLRWIPTGKLLNSCTGKVDSEPAHGSIVDIPHIHACKQTLGLSAGTSFNGQKQQRIDLNADALYNEKQENLRVWLLKLLISKKPVPECNDGKSQAVVLFCGESSRILEQRHSMLFKRRRIEHQTSTPRTPEQNGVVERRNRTLVEAARTMLSASKLPLSFWAEAVEAPLLFSETDSIIISTHGKTEYPIINDRNPLIKNLLHLGCISYITRDGENLDR
ncbi:integrase, catalytic region, zinc finger, CCHC-type containing protein [Tanacetum coccineum]